MERRLDSIKWEKDFDLDDFQCTAVWPLKALANALVESHHNEEVKAVDRLFLSQLLQEQIFDLDECFNRLIDERLAFSKKNKKARSSN